MVFRALKNSINLINQFFWITTQNSLKYYQFEITPQAIREPPPPKGGLSE